MLLTIHNLPVQTQYQDVKQLILTKCGLEDAILDNLQNEGSGMRVTVGVSEEEDAAILVRKINGLFYGGQQLYVQNKRQKRELDQPYRSNVAQPQFVPQTQPIYDYSQVQAMGMFPAGQMTMYPARPVTQAVQGVYMAYGQQQYSEAVMPQYAGPLNEFGNPAYDQGDFGLVQSEKLFASSADVPTPGQPGQGQASPQWEQKPPQRENRRLQKDEPSQRFGGRPQKEEGPPQRFGGPPKRFGGRPQRDDRSPQRFGGRSQRDNGRPDKDYGLPQRYNERQQRFEGRQQKDDGRPQRYQGQLQTFDERPQRDEGRPQRDDRGPQIYDRRPQRDDRRRPASPFRPNRAPETEPDPKRPKRDSRDDRFNRNDPQSRFREEPERSANSTRFDNRAKISGQTRWDAPRSDQRPELFIRREPPARIACNDTESDWKAWNPTAGQVDMPNQSSTTYNEFGLDPTMPDHSPAKFNKFNQGPSKAEQGSTAYNKFGLSSFITGQGSTTNTYGPGSSKTDQGSTFNSFGQSSSMPFQGPATYNKFNQGLSVPDPNSTKNKHKYSTVADQHNIKYNMFTDGTDMRNQGSTKYHKVKAKETIMSQIVANAKAKDILNGPSTFKNLLRKICAARIDDAVGTDEMFNDEIVRRYRSKYPTSGDQKLYNDIQKKLLECPNMNFKEMWEWALVMVPGARKPPIFPPKPPPPREKVARPPAAPKGPLPKPIGPFASKNKYDLCVGKLSAHVMYDMSRTLDFDFQLSENHRVRTLLRKAVAARVGDIVVKMEAAPAHILPHYRKKYPRKTDKELYDKALIALEHSDGLPAPGVVTGAGTLDSGPVASLSAMRAAIPLYPTKKKKLSGAQKRRRAIERQNAITDGLAVQTPYPSHVSTTRPEVETHLIKDDLPVDGMAIEDSGSLPAADAATGAGTSDSGPVASVSVEPAADPLKPKKKKKKVCGSEKRRRKRALELRNSITDGVAGETTNPSDVSTGPEQASTSLKEALTLDGVAIENSSNVAAPDAAKGAGTLDPVPANPVPARKKKMRKRAQRFARETSSPSDQTTPEQRTPSLTTGTEQGSSSLTTGPEQGSSSVTKGLIQGLSSFTTEPEQGSPSPITGLKQGSSSPTTRPEQGSPILTSEPKQRTPSLTIGPDQGSPSLIEGPEEESPSFTTRPEQLSPSLISKTELGSPSLTTEPEQVSPSVSTVQHGSPITGSAQRSPFFTTGAEPSSSSLTTGPEGQLTAQSIKEFGESCVIPSQPKPNKAPNTAVPSQPVPNKAPNTAAADGTVNKIPKYPQGDKNVHRQEKKQHIQDLRSMTQFDNDGTFKQALDKEMEAIGTLMQNILNNPETRDEKLIYGDMKKGNMVTECTKLIGHHISKRLTDRGPKLVRIYGHPKPPKRSDLEDFLCKNKFNCISLKKSVTSPFYTASFDSYDTIDALCNLPPVLVGSDIAVEFKYMHIFKSSLMNDNTKKVKMSKKARKNLIKKMVENLIDESKVNLLDKDWPAQEEAEKKAKAEKNKTCDESEDVIHVDSEIKTIDITGDDDEDGNDKTNDNDNNITEREFLNDEFQVIDEVRESEDDGPVEEEKDKNEISDDWDQTGEDWGDETGGGDTASDKNAGDGGQGHDENAIETSFGENNDLGETDDEIGDVIGENAEDIDIADVEFDEDDLEDY